MENVEKDYYTRTYRFIGMMNDVEEKARAKKYCTSIMQRLFFEASGNAFFRKFCMKIYTIKKR
jgi:hypothetical protein